MYSPEQVPALVRAADHARPFQVRRRHFCGVFTFKCQRGTVFLPGILQGAEPSALALALWQRGRENDARYGSESHCHCFVPLPFFFSICFLT